MKLVYYELKKLAGIRYLGVLFLLMAALAAGMFYVSYQNSYSAPGGAQKPTGELFAAYDEFYRQYSEDPGRIEKLAAEYEDYLTELEAVEAEFRKTHPLTGVSEEEADRLYRELDTVLDAIRYENKLGFYYEDGTPIDDAVFFRSLKANALKEQNYREFLGTLLVGTSNSMHRYELLGAADSPMYEYQKHFYDRYSALDGKVTFIREYSRGWSLFLNFDALGLFIYAYLILAAGVVFLNERGCGFINVLRTTRKGRFRTTASKIAAMNIMAVAVTAAFTAALYLACAFTVGFSSADAPIQSIRQECPYLLTVGEYALAQLGTRCVCAAAFASAVGIIAALTYSPVAAYITGAVILLANLAVNAAVSYSDKLLLNLFSMSTERTLGSYSEILLFGHYRSTHATGVVMYLLIAAAVCALTVLVSGRRSFMQKPTARAWRIPARAERRDACGDEKPSRRTLLRGCTSSLFLWECRKRFVPLTAAAAAVLLALSAYDANSYYGEDVSALERDYESYLDESGLFGELTDEKLRYIEGRKRENAEYLEYSFSEMADRLTNGEITYEEYSDYLSGRDAAAKESDLLERVDEQITYLDKVEAETGAVGWIIPKTRISRVLDRDVNIFLFAAVVVIFARTYSVDYESRSSEGVFANIASTTKRGRRGSLNAKLSSTAAITFAVTSAFAAVDIAFAISSTDGFFRLMSAPSASVEKYSAFGNLTLGGCLVISFAIRVLAFELLAFITVAASFLVRRVSPTLFVVSLPTLLPYALVYMGVRPLKYVDLTAALSGGKLLSRSAEFAVFGGAYGFAIVLLAAYALISIAAVMYVRQRTGK